jgi:cell division septal protein FtsQ
MTALVLFAAGLWLLYSLMVDERFAVRQVVVAGAQHVSEEQVRDLVHPQFIGGNPSLFLVNSQALGQRIMATYGQMNHVAVRCTLPGTVHITLTERADALLWESGGRYWWADMGGNVLGALEHEPPTVGDAQPALTVHDVESWSPTPEGHISGVPWELVRDLAVVLPTAREYEYSRSLGLVVRITEAHYPVFLGHSGSAAVKVAIMRQLAADLASDGAAVAYVDLRNDNRLLLKLR